MPGFKAYPPEKGEVRTNPPRVPDDPTYWGSENDLLRIPLLTVALCVAIPLFLFGCCAGSLLIAGEFNTESHSCNRTGFGLFFGGAIFLAIGLAALAILFWERAERIVWIIGLGLVLAFGLTPFVWGWTRHDSCQLQFLRGILL